MKREPRIKGYRSQVCSQGHRHDSVGEATYCNQLFLLKQQGHIKDYQNQVTFDLKINGKRVCQHRPDFLITNMDGTQEVHEFKGFETAIFHLKYKMFKACYPDIPYFIKTRKDLFL